MKCYTHNQSDAVGTCTTCGRAVCPDCRHEVSGMLRCGQHAAATLPPPPPLPIPQEVEARIKSPGLAFLLGLFSGLGHLYLGLYRRSLSIFGTFVLMIFLADNVSEFFGLGVAFTVFFSAFDAFRMAKLINRGAAMEDPSAELLDAGFKPGQGSLMLGVAFLLLGLFAWIEMRWDIDLGFIRDNWPIAMVGFGAWLIWRAMKNKKDAEDARSEDSGGSYAA